MQPTGEDIEILASVGGKARGLKYPLSYGWGNLSPGWATFP